MRVAGAGVLGILWACSAGASGSVVTLCADPDPPPWSFWVRDAQGAKTRAIGGFSIDLMNEVFARLDTRVRWIGDYPWARCMKEVEEGRVDFALGAYFDAQRAERFAYSRPYSTLTPQVFFHRSRPIDVRNTADLKRYAGCGMIGASYAHYGLGPKDLDAGVNTYGKLVTKLKAGRCDYFVEELEIIVGLKGLGEDHLGAGDILHGPVAGARAPAHHLIAGKSTAAAQRLPEVNRVLEQLIRSGAAARHWRRHAGDLPYRP